MLEYIFEPSPRAVLDFMLPYYVQYQVFQMILDARASEHSARMVAMKNATDNANQFIKDLTLEIQQDAAGQHHDGIARDRDRPDGGRWLSFHESSENNGRHPARTTAKPNLFCGLVPV